MQQNEYAPSPIPTGDNHRPTDCRRPRGIHLLAQHRPNQSRVDLDNSDQIALGQTVYTNNCASCHGAKLEGQPNWRQRRGDGRLPAPPHDESGHTWHHSDFVLFDLTKNGPQSLIGSDYQSDMPAFSDSLDDEEIWAVITFIKSTWSPRIHRIQAEAEKKRR